MALGKMLDSAGYQCPLVMAAIWVGLLLAWVAGIVLMHQHHKLVREEGHWAGLLLREAGLFEGALQQRYLLSIGWDSVLRVGNELDPLVAQAE